MQAGPAEARMAVPEQHMPCQASGHCPVLSLQPVAPLPVPVDTLEKELKRKKRFEGLRKWAANQGPGTSRAHKK